MTLYKYLQNKVTFLLVQNYHNNSYIKLYRLLSTVTSHENVAVVLCPFFVFMFTPLNSTANNIFYALHIPGLNN